MVAWRWWQTNHIGWIAPALFFFSSLSLSMTVSAAKIPLWIDCDPGHDDAFAILLGSNLPAIFHLVGISTVHGNASLKHTTNNALSLVEAFLAYKEQGSSVNVYPGAAKPLSRPPMGHAPTIHGESGLDGTNLLPHPQKEAVWNYTDSKRSSLSAVEALAAAARKYPGTLAVVATGALTNIATFVEAYPELVANLRILGVMGGAFAAGGNFTRYAEFNIWCDPEAAKIVLGSQADASGLEKNELAKKTVLLTLDITHKAIATKEIRSKVLNGSNESTKKYYVRQMLYELLVFFGQTYEREFGDQFAQGPPVHDPLAVVGILPLYYAVGESHPDLPELKIKYTRYALDVATENSDHVGQTVKLREDSENGVYVVESMDMEAFWGLVLESLDNLDARA